MSSSSKRIVVLTPCTGDVMEGLEFVQLSHPRGGVPVMYCKQDSTHSILELQTCQVRRHGAWFLDQRVSSDVHFYMASKIDCRFLLLPHLEAKEKYSPMDQIVPFPSEGCARVPLAWISEWKLEEICDINDSFGDDQLLYRLNRPKMLEWLRKKVIAAATAIARQRTERSALLVKSRADGFNISAQSSSSAASANPAPAASTTTDGANTSGSGSDEYDDNDKRLALQIVCDYISPTLATAVTESFGLSPREVSAAKTAPVKRKADWELELELENDKSASVSTIGVSAFSAGNGGSAAPKPKPKPAASAAKKAGGKNAPPPKGVASISSFFGKKA
jgi:hypothetical protein